MPLDVRVHDEYAFQNRNAKRKPGFSNKMKAKLKKIQQRGNSLAAQVVNDARTQPPMP